MNTPVVNAARRPTVRAVLLLVIGCASLVMLCSSRAVGQVNSPTAPPVSARNADRTDPLRNVLFTARSWTLADLMAWLHRHGLSILLIFVLAIAILWLAGNLQARAIRLLAIGASRGNRAEQENRARTVVSVLYNALRTTVVAAATIMVLEEVGVPVGPLLGGVAVVGLAVAFGTQSLIKDYFTGFLVLLEQQYMIGDVIKIANITGQVEQITLRLTALRDLDGSVHFIPHGQITTVTNLTHGWSQAIFDLQVPNGESVDRVKQVFFEATGALRADPTFGPMILDEPRLLGVDSLADATYTVKFVVKTQPQKRLEVKRELLGRLARRFQEMQLKVIIPA